jgi:hypothetical protein
LTSREIQIFRGFPTRKIRTLLPDDIARIEWSEEMYRGDSSKRMNYAIWAELRDGEKIRLTTSDAEKSSRELLAWLQDIYSI